ncbi:2Fe-2S iron-sulfur cluster-binding protein [Paenibacillus sp. 1P07SE]|uniref:2Fe-2S iron-sulfur cluster-binding protein n=1 Tax=Paenibacillus sp. 1P07SE TaxID=3132209 RepID=UPI0039A6DFAF
MTIMVRFMPEDRTIRVKAGSTVMDAARLAGIAIRSRCGGKAGCLMCKVSDITPGGQGLLPASELERRKLAGQLGEGIRLSCQARLGADAVIEVPEDPLRAAVRRRLAEAQQEDELW